MRGNVNFVPRLPDWKIHALKHCEMAVYNKIFIKFADSVRPFWDKTQWLHFVDSEPVTNQGNIARSNSPAVQYALKRGDNYTRGYFTVCRSKMPCF